MSGTLTRPIKTLGLSENQGRIEIKIVPMIWSHIEFWHTYVQPLIDLNYVPSAPGISPQKVRADVGWDWWKNYALCQLHNFATVAPGNYSSQAIALTVVGVSTSADGNEGAHIPIGMLTVVPKFNCNVHNTYIKRAFAWYLADAPSEFYRDTMNVAPVKGVAMTLLDSVIQSGLDAGGNGCTLLHADPNGGQKLVDFYTQKCGMVQLEPGQAVVSFLRRWNIEEYFHMDETQAQRFCANFDKWR